MISSAHAETPAALPNVIVILSDDVGWGDLGCYGATKTKTPNLDALAKEGLRFTDAHASAAVCTPTRYSMLTGEYSWRKTTVGLNKGVANADSPLLIPVGSTTLPSIMKKAGYRTAAIGKWHLGFGTTTPDYNKDLAPGPLEIGFDEFFGLPATNDRVPTVFVRDHCVVGLDPADPIRYTFDPKIAAADGMKKYAAGRDRIGFMSGGKAAWWKDESIADTFTHEVLGFIERNKEKPFFLYFATHDVHTPTIPNPRFVGITGLGNRADMLCELDWSVGEVMKTLERLGLSKNTLVLYSSDNGAAHTNEDSHLPNGHWRGKKSQLWEGGHRVPLIARWPGHIAPGSTSDDLVCLVDLAATAAAIVGQKLPDGAAPDSFNLLPTLLGQPEHLKRDSLVVMSGNGDLAIRQGGWKYIPDLDLVDGWQSGAKKPNQAAKPALYDLSTDKGETKNLLQEKPEIAKRMVDLLEKAQYAKSTRPLQQ
ncbi:MAG: arylsulfatase [Verrucomicrobia bacterium]|nr:arylsulfatase [Verrucomicrobiota bacterium]